MGRARGRFAITAGFLLIAALAVPSGVSAGTKVEHVQTIEHHEITTRYIGDDICGPRGGWTTFDVTWHFIVTDLGSSYHVTFMETGWYTTDLDDPSFEDYTGQFTDTVHVNLTPGGTSVTTDSFHDFPGTITIKVRTVLVEVGGEIQVDRSVFEVTGCP